MEFSSKAAPKITKDISTIKSVEELKQADLRGEHYTISDEQLIKAIDRAIQAMQGTTTDLEFSVHEKTKMIA
ncbi:flagellar protein FlaG, partial [Klebsiella pneumoniae]|uniref:flagellar protein FlaG n=1 Tax=Klebsiella pneumoniae TaxID=573 RepID=UPI00298D2863